MLAEQMLSWLSHASSPLCFGYFRDGCYYLPRLVSTCDPSNLSLQVGRIAGVIHWHWLSFVFFLCLCIFFTFLFVLDKFLEVLGQRIYLMFHYVFLE
jgi:hypothetical protein